MSGGLGKQSYCQVGTETVGAWGTMVAATQNLEVVDDSFEPMSEYIEDPSLSNNFSPRDLIQVSLRAGGAQKLRANYDGQLQHLRAFFGGYSTNAPTSGVLDHNFVEGDQRSLSIRSVRGDIPTGQCWHLPGTRFHQLVFEVKAKQLATLAFDGVAKDMIPGQALTTSQSFPAVLPVKFNHVGGGMFADGTGDSDPLNVQSVKITCLRPLDTPYDIGSINMQEPDLQSFFRVTWEVTYRMKSKAAADILRAGTVSTLDLKFQDPAIIGSTLHREMQWTSWNARCVGFKPPIAGYNRIISTAIWEAFFEASSASILTCRVRNTQTALP